LLFHTVREEKRREERETETETRQRDRERQRETERRGQPPLYKSSRPQFWHTEAHICKENDQDEQGQEEARERSEG
jgi:hypothetical protein